jgi:uncharacterized protein (DUF1778 family)
MAATTTTTIRISAADKRRLAAAARRRGISTHKFILEAALARAAAKPDDDKLARLEALVARVHEAVEDELDYRLADAAWQRHVKSGSRLYSSDEIKRELGL